jgi:hypothetical protein
MKTPYSDAATKGICWGCDGKGRQGEGEFTWGCDWCSGTGAPGEEQIRRAGLEELGLCSNCQLDLTLHHERPSGWTCTVAAQEVIKDLLYRVEQLESALRDLGDRVTYGIE